MAKKRDPVAEMKKAVEASGRMMKQQIKRGWNPVTQTKFRRKK